MQKQKIIVISVISVLTVAIVAISVFLGWQGSSEIKLVLKPDGDDAVVATIIGEIEGAVQISLSIQTPEGYSFDSLVDLEDSDRVLRVGRVENNTVIFRAACESGLPETIGAFRFSVFSKDSKPDFFVSEISCSDIKNEKISVKFSVKK